MNLLVLGGSELTLKLLVHKPCFSLSLVLLFFAFPFLFRSLSSHLLLPSPSRFLFLHSFSLFTYHFNFPFALMACRLADSLACVLACWLACWVFHSSCPHRPAAAETSGAPTSVSTPPTRCTHSQSTAPHPRKSPCAKQCAAARSAPCVERDSRTIEKACT